MKYDKDKYNRKSIRLKGYNYSQLGMYFITICCKDQISRFGEIVKGKMILNDCGKIAFNEWKSLPIRFPQMKMDALQIMPNHMHAIVNLVGATLAVAPIPVAPIP
ncbi:MAG: hypothetical protein OEW75_18560, partial [Cyclobacteriaceae bacterium]|nr:hypothetical protein [Cyclobacteriaceae bacterium]